MTLDDYQKAAMRTSREELTPREHVLNGALGLAGEVGECCDLVKKHFFQDGREVETDLKEELGDVLWYCAELATSMGWSLADVARGNIEKLAARYPDGYDSNRSLNRGEAG